MDQTVRDFVARVVGNLPPRRQVLEVGSLIVNGTTRDLFAAADRYEGIDVRRGPGVDIVADGVDYQPDFCPDTVVCLSVLEHADDPAGIVRHAASLLGEGGALILTAPVEPYATHSWSGHALPPGESYCNIDLAELQDWLGAFRHVEMEHSPNHQVLVVAMK